MPLGDELLRGAAPSRKPLIVNELRHHGRRAELAREIDSGTDGPTLRRLEREQAIRSVMECQRCGWRAPTGRRINQPAQLVQHFQTLFIGQQATERAAPRISIERPSNPVITR
jgi:hypothetical protein